MQGQVDIVPDLICLRICHGPCERTQHQTYQCIGLTIADAKPFLRFCGEVSTFGDWQPSIL